MSETQETCDPFSTIGAELSFISSILTLQMWFKFLRFSFLNSWRRSMRHTSGYILANQKKKYGIYQRV